MAVPPMKNERAWHLFCLGTDLISHPDQSPGSHSYASDDDMNNDGDSVTDAPAEEGDSLDEIFAKLKRRKVEISDAPPGPAVRQAEAEIWAGSRGVRPTMALLLQCDQVLVQRLLGMHAAWLLDA